MLSGARRVKDTNTGRATGARVSEFVKAAGELEYSIKFLINERWQRRGS